MPFTFQVAIFIDAKLLNIVAPYAPSYGYAAGRRWPGQLTGIGGLSIATAIGSLPPGERGRLDRGAARQGRRAPGRLDVSGLVWFGWSMGGGRRGLGGLCRVRQAARSHRTETWVQPRDGGVRRACSRRRSQRHACRGRKRRGHRGGGCDRVVDLPRQFQQTSFGAQSVEVGVDADTAEIRVRRTLSVCDAGRILNPKTARLDPPSLILLILERRHRRAPSLNVDRRHGGNQARFFQYSSMVPV